MVLPTSSTASTECTCRHSLDCNCECHGRHCDPTEHVCSIEFLPDEGGLTPWGCPVCTPGSGLPHAASCPAAALAPASVPEILLVGDAGRADVALSDSGGGNAPSAR
jgi:hypothetical protein